jgi:hypothetical protein
MPRRAIGERPMTASERSARRRARRDAEREAMAAALRRIAIEARTLTEARNWARDAMQRSASGRE